MSEFHFSIIEAYGYHPESCCCDTFQVRAGHRTGSPRSAADEEQNLLRMLDAVRRSSEHECLPGMPGNAWCVAGAEPAGGGICGAFRHGAELRDSGDINLRPQKLLLSRPTQGLPDFAVQQADRGARLHRDRLRKWPQTNRHHASAL